jgi:ABC-2 type transport system ATP-binding protein
MGTVPGAGRSPDNLSPAIVACRGLGKSFDDHAVVRDVGLEIQAGTIVGLIGPSGCGKTTTVRLLTGLYEPTTGEAWVDGTPATELSHSQRARIGYLPQIPALFPELSMWENLSFHASMYGLRLRRKRRLRQLLDWVELTADRDKRVSAASGGMQRRLALAAAFVHDPTLVFLDEPTAGIDPILRAKFWEQFQELRNAGRTLIVTTQYVGEAAECDLVGVLSDGELVMLDTPANLLRAAYGGDVLDVELERMTPDLDVLRDVDGVVGRPTAIGPTSWQVVVADSSAACPTVRDALEHAGAGNVEVRDHPVDYDESFVRIIERHRAATADRAEGDEGDKHDSNTTPAEVRA